MAFRNFLKKRNTETSPASVKRIVDTPPSAFGVQPFQNPASAGPRIRFECLCSNCGRSISQSDWYCTVKLVDPDGSIREEKQYKCPDCGQIESGRYVILNNP